MKLTDVGILYLDRQSMLGVIIFHTEPNNGNVDLEEMSAFIGLQIAMDLCFKSALEDY